MLRDRIDAVLDDDALWPRDEVSATALQRELSVRVRAETLDAAAVGLVAGLDVCYAVDDSQLWAAVVVLDAATWEPVESVVVQDTPRFGYVPGLFAFRELPALLKALRLVESAPDVLVCDGAGRAHPRRFGLASHLGLLLDVPAIGCAKTMLFGEHSPVGAHRGQWAALTAPDGEVVGRAVRTRTGVRPVYVSEGHRVDLDGSTGLVLRAASRYRIPEPVRAADHACGRARAAARA